MDAHDISLRLFNSGCYETSNLVSNMRSKSLRMMLRNRCYA